MPQADRPVGAAKAKAQPTEERLGGNFPTLADSAKQGRPAKNAAPREAKDAAAPMGAKTAMTPAWQAAAEKPAQPSAGASRSDFPLLGNGGGAKAEVPCFSNSITAVLARF